MLRREVLTSKYGMLYFLLSLSSCDWNNKQNAKIGVNSVFTNKNDHHSCTYKTIRTQLKIKSGEYDVFLSLTFTHRNTKTHEIRNSIYLTKTFCFRGYLSFGTLRERSKLNLIWACWIPNGPFVFAFTVVPFWPDLREGWGVFTS